MNAQLRSECATPMMEEPGLVRHVVDLDRRSLRQDTSDTTILTAERIARYLERGSLLRSEWWIGKIKAVSRGAGWLLGRPGISRRERDLRVFAGREATPCSGS